MSCELRRATSEDEELLLEWTNDPVTRANSLRQELIPSRSHAAWLRQKLASTHDRLWILECDNAPVGQIRYERKGQQAVISLSVAPTCRGRGLGGLLLELSIPRACRELAVDKLVGIVKRANLPSVRTFERAGFARALISEEPDTTVLFERACSPCEHEFSS